MHPFFYAGFWLRFIVLDSSCIWFILVQHREFNTGT